MAVEHWLQLALAPGLGPVTLRRLLDAAGSAEAACSASAALLKSIEGIGEAKSRQILAGIAAAARDVSRQIDRAAEMGIDIVPCDDPRYPPLLRSIHDPPTVLFVRGTLEPRDLNAIAIVGSRRCSSYGREQATRFSGILAASGFTVISGGARGVDSAAHRGAMVDPNGRTIAVLGCGADLVYPPENVELFEQIAAQGAVISEYPFGTQPTPENFPRRNRIVSGMSRAVLVIEADERSGALITAHTACEQNRTVFALPGRIDNPLSAGPHKLIREGATLITGMQDLVDGLSPLPADVDEPLLVDDVPPTPTPAPAPHAITATAPAPHRPPVESRRADSRPAVVPVTAQQQAVLDAIDDTSTHVDVIVQQTGLEAHIVLQELTLLSLKGLIRRVDGQSYSRKR